ncbi:hypothetical protein [Thermacetogenium phaeum]|uniref:hypothetical protein n=1 Tax=Thermacetogenium phaeum TaxID=85874 RepID=UPI0002FD615F|nr:hypothetical protein [Thermacetogenium phaeum]
MAGDVEYTFLGGSWLERRQSAAGGGASGSPAEAGNTHIKGNAKYDTRKERRDKVTCRPTTCKETVRQSLKTPQA